MALFSADRSNDLGSENHRICIMRASFYQKRYRKLNVWVIQCLVMVFATIGASKANGMTPVMSSSLAAPAPVGSMVMFSRGSFRFRQSEHLVSL